MRRLWRPVVEELVPYDAAGKVVAGLVSRAWDVCFLAIDPLRAQEISFTAPYTPGPDGWQRISATLDQFAGDKKRAADVLGISLKTLYNRLGSYKAA